MIGLLPLILPVAFFVVLPAKPEYGFTDSGKKYLKVDTPTHVPLLGTRAFWLLFSVCLSGAAAWALTEAIASAVHSGTISLPGRRKHPRPVVPWPAAWSYFTGMACLLLSSLGPRFATRGSSLRLWLTVIGVFFGIAGYTLVLLSSLLSTWQGAGIFFAMSAVVVACLWWRNRP